MPDSSLHLPEFLRQLAQRIQAIEADQRRHQGLTLPLGIPALDGILPDKGLPAGALVELLSTTDGAGSATLGLIMARQAAGADKTLVVVDRSRCFYPPAAARWGIDWQRLLLVRPAAPRDAFAAAHLALRCDAVGAVLAWCDRLSALQCRRLQLAAEEGGGLGVLLRNAVALPTPSFATLRLLVAPVPSPAAAVRLRVDVVRCRGGRDGQSFILEMNREEGAVYLLPEMAASASRARAARVSG
jgi:protein ImuA